MDERNNFKSYYTPSQQMTSRQDQCQTKKTSKRFIDLPLQVAEDNLSTSSSPTLPEPTYPSTDRTQHDEAANSVREK